MEDENSIPAGQFKARCLQILDEVERTRTTRIVTKRGRPVARLTPFTEVPTGSLFGCLQGSLQIKADIVAPTGEEWDAET